MSEERISIIVPVLDEAATLTACLMTLESLCDPDVEIIVADGGSADATPEIARGRAHVFVHAPRGRGSQMNAGAALATGDILLFLHADTRLPSGALDVIRRAISAGAQWGRFDVRIEGRSRALRLVGAMMNLRSRLSGIATGDQAIFVRRTVFDAAGGYPDIALMEDVALSGALRALVHPACLRPPVATSGRRWEKHGVLRTIVLMWRLRAAYWLGADPDELARRYGYQPRNGPQARLAGVRTEEKRPPDA